MALGGTIRRNDGGIANVVDVVVIVAFQRGYEGE